MRKLCPTLGVLIRNETLYNLCKQGLISTLDYVNRLISEGEAFSQTIRYKTIIEEDQFRGFEPYIAVNKGIILQRHMSDIENLLQVIELSEFIERIVKDKGSEVKVKKITSDYLDTLFYTYADLKPFPRFDQKGFDQSYSLLENYMYGTLEYRCYAPLYDFQMADATIRLNDGFIIRKLKPDEYLAIANNTENEAPFLRYAIRFNCTIFEYNQKSRLELDRIITSLRLFKHGTASCSEVYSIPAIGSALGRSVRSRPRSMQHVPEYQLDGGEGKKFRRFHTHLNNVIRSIDENSFFYIAIDRFNSALEEKEAADKIIDLSIALEALLSTSSEDLTYKLRIRISVLLGNDYEPDYLYDFVVKAYDIRSKLVHGKIGKNKTEPVFKLGTKEYRLYDVAKDLEQITRRSILRMLLLSRHHNYNQKTEYLTKIIDRVAIGYPKSNLGLRKRLGL